MPVADLSDIWTRPRPRDRPTVRLRWLWDPNPDAKVREDAEVPGPWSPLLALAPRLRAVRDLARRLRVSLRTAKNDKNTGPAGRPASATDHHGAAAPQSEEG